MEDEYLKQKATFTNQRNELYERRDRLARIVEDEAGKIGLLFFKKDNIVTKMENSFIGVYNN